MNEEKEKKVHLKFFGIPAMIPFVKPHKKQIISIILFMAIGAGAEAAMPLFQDYAINHFIGENTLDTLGIFIAAYAALVIISAVSQMIGAFNSANTEVLVDRDVRRKLFNHVQTLSFSYFNHNSVGYIHSRIISDPNRIGLLISWVLLDSVVNIIYIITILVIMMCLNWQLGLILFLIMPLMAAVTAFFKKYIVRENRRIREINSIITSNFNEGITGARTIKSLAIEDKMQKDFEKDTADMYRASVKSGRLRAGFFNIVMLVSGTGLAAVLWHGGNLTADGLILIGTLSVFMSYAVSMVAYITDMVDSVSMLIISQVNIERVLTVLNTKPDVEDTPAVTEKYGDAFNPKKENWEEFYGDVEFDDVTFRYPDAGEDEYVLEHFNLKVPKGTAVAIAGETGAGKSTLVNLVCRFFEPVEGRVLIDGRDARERSQLWLHSNIGYVLQTPHLFSGSIRENLMYGKQDATDEELMNALRTVGADRIVENLENGLDTDVGEGGERLSTGEKQLISFARALLADPAILILDEATSSVDTLTEKKIQEATARITEGRTSFIVAHRLSTIRGADIILVMRDGKIVESGKHDELMKAGNYYYELYTAQFADEASQEALKGTDTDGERP